MSVSNRSLTRLLLGSVAVGALMVMVVFVAGAAGVVIDLATVGLCVAARRPKPRSPFGPVQKWGHR